MSVVLAYIDPGSGSIVFYAIVGAVTAAGTSIAVFWQRITSRFRKRG